MNIPVTSILLEKKFFLKTASLQMGHHFSFGRKPSFSFHHSIKSSLVIRTDAELRGFQLLLVFLFQSCKNS